MFNVGELIKINEELCPEAKRQEPKFQFGSLNYLALMLDWNFEVVRVFKDDYHGDMAECKIMNVDNIKSNVVVKLADMVIAKSFPIKLQFEILSKVNKFQDQIDELTKQHDELIKTRAELKMSGLPVTDKVLIDNWGKVKKLRPQIKKLEECKVKVLRVKHKFGVSDFDCTEEELPSRIRSLIRTKRNELKQIKPTVKSITSGLSYEKIGGVLTKSGEFSRINEKFALSLIKEHKKPTTTDNYVGIEIEMLAPKSIDDMNKEFIKARLHKFVNIGTDGSINSEVSGFTAMELRICLPESLLDTHVKLIADVLRKNDCYANRSCGMHVHLDMRNRNAELAYKNFFKVQGLMFASQPTSRRTNKYCKPNTKESLTLSQFNEGDRYQAINTQSYYKNDMRTLEIRLHEGATKYRDIINWVKFLVGVASLSTEIPTAINTIDELRQSNIVSSSIVDHLQDRVEEYSA